MAILAVPILRMGLVLQVILNCTTIAVYAVALVALVLYARKEEKCSH